MKIGFLFIGKNNVANKKKNFSSFLKKIAFKNLFETIATKEIIGEVSFFYKEAEFINLNTLCNKNKKNSNILEKLFLIKDLLEKNEIDKSIIISKEPIFPFMYFAKFKTNVVGLCDNVETAKLTVEHNNANVLIIDNTNLVKSDIFSIVKTFIESKFSSGRHQYRIDILTKGIE